MQDRLCRRGGEKDGGVGWEGEDEDEAIQ